MKRERGRLKCCDAESKTCQDCGEVLTDLNWTASMQKYRRYVCRTCWAARQKRYADASRAKNPDYLKNRREKAKANRESWSQERKDEERKKRYAAWLNRRFGLSLSDLEKMIESHNNQCAICGTKTPMGRGGFHVDHCHKSGVVRGLLCQKCNILLGHAKDDAQRLFNAAEYLRSHAGKGERFVK